MEEDLWNLKTSVHLLDPAGCMMAYGQTCPQQKDLALQLLEWDLQRLTMADCCLLYCAADQETRLHTSVPVHA